MYQSNKITLEHLRRQHQTFKDRYRHTYHHNNTEEEQYETVTIPTRLYNSTTCVKLENLSTTPPPPTTTPRLSLHKSQQLQLQIQELQQQQHAKNGSQLPTLLHVPAYSFKHNNNNNNSHGCHTSRQPTRKRVTIAKYLNGIKQELYVVGNTTVSQEQQQQQQQHLPKIPTLRNHQQQQQQQQHANNMMTVLPHPTTQTIEELAIHSSRRKPDEQYQNVHDQLQRLQQEEKQKKYIYYLSNEKANTNSLRQWKKQANNRFNDKTRGTTTRHYFELVESERDDDVCQWDREDELSGCDELEYFVKKSATVPTATVTRI